MGCRRPASATLGLTLTTRPLNTCGDSRRLGGVDSVLWHRLRLFLLRYRIGPKRGLCRGAARERGPAAARADRSVDHSSAGGQRRSARRGASLPAPLSPKQRRHPHRNRMASDDRAGRAGGVGPARPGDRDPAPCHSRRVPRHDAGRVRARRPAAGRPVPRRATGTIGARTRVDPSAAG